MKFSGFSSLLLEIERFGTRNCSRNLYSSKAMPSNKPWNELYNRMAPIADQKVSIVPVLDRWVEQGRHVDRDILKALIKELRFYKRYTHALQISQWMIEKRYQDLTSSDVAIRLDLISKSQGIERVGEYFNDVPQQLRDIKVYGSLHHCYKTAKLVEKAEQVMEKMKGLISSSFDKRPIAYNSMLDLYSKVGNMEKFNALLQEMEENGIARDKFTVAIQLRAYADAKDIEGIDKMVTLMESDPNFVPDFIAYSVAANSYRIVGLMDKALEMLKKSEAIATTEKRCRAYNYLFTQYASIGRKDEVLRLWSVYKKNQVVYNKGYLCIIESLVKLGDLEMAEICFQEWESLGRFYDIKIVNILIGAYCVKGLLAKAEALIDRVIAWTWYQFAVFYLENDQPEKAVEMMKRALVVSESFRLPCNKYIAACIEYLKGMGDIEQAHELIELLLEKAIISSDMQEKLLNAVKTDNSVEICALLEQMDVEEKFQNKSEMFV